MYFKIFILKVILLLTFGKLCWNSKRLYSVPLWTKPKFSFPVNIYLPIFYGYLPINKADTLSVKGGLLEDNTILIKYTVHKKKLKCDIDIYLRLLPLL